MALEFVKPSEKYSRELKAVAREALRLRETLTTANRLPTDFPAEALESSISALVRLPKGTAEGSIVTLRGAHSLCQMIRNTYLAIEDEDEPEQANDEAPLITRDEPLGARIGLLYAAIGDAIEQYKRESGEELDIDTESDKVAPEGADLGLETLRDDIDHTMADANVVASTLGELPDEAVPSVENAKRMVDDARSQLDQTRAETQIGQPRAGVMEWLGKGISGTATALEIGGKLLEAGADVSEPGIELYHDLKKDAWLGLIGSLKKNRQSSPGNRQTHPALARQFQIG